MPTATATYPETLADLHGYPEASTIHTRGYDARWQARQRIGYSEEAACRLLECSPEELHACERGLLDTTWVGDVPYPLPDIMLPTAAKRLRYAYARFLSATEQLPPRPVPVDRGVRAPHGHVNAGKVEWLRKGSRGETASLTPGTCPRPGSRIQALTTFGLNVNTLAEAIGADANDVATWMNADARDLPWGSQTSTTFLEFCRLLKWLLSGPTMNETRAMREGRMY